MQKNMNKRGVAGILIGIGIVVAAAIIIGGGTLMYFSGTSFSVTGDPDSEETGAWEDQQVKLSLKSNNAYNSTQVAPTIKWFSEKPADWGNPTGDFTQGLIETTTLSASADTTEYRKPGTYYAVEELSGYNTKFAVIEVPSSSGTTSLSDYNSAGGLVPDADVLNMKTTDTLSTSSIDMGISSSANYTTDQKFTTYAYFTVDNDQEYIMQSLKVKSNAANITDSDSDGIWDWGVEHLEINDKIVFDAGDNINLLAGDYEYDFNFGTTDEPRGKVYGEETQVSIKIELTCDQTNNMPATAESCVNGEAGFILVFKDTMGTTASVTPTW